MVTRVMNSANGSEKLNILLALEMELCEAGSCQANIKSESNLRCQLSF
jgi:hypothetical protein